MDLNEFVTKYNNKYIDTDGVYGHQCVDLIKQYTLDVFWITLWTFGGSAKTGRENASNTFPSDTWEKIDNDITDINQVPLEWDIIFWGYGTNWHTAVVLKWYEWEDRVSVFNQNTGNWNGKWYDDRSRIQDQSYNGILGWYRKKDSEIDKLKEENFKLKSEIKTLNYRMEQINELSR